MEGHCLIVPMQHYHSTLEMDDDDWDEVKVGSSVMTASPPQEMAAATIKPADIMCSLLESYEMPHANVC